MQSADKRYILQRNTVQTETGFISLYRLARSKSYTYNIQSIQDIF